MVFCKTTLIYHNTCSIFNDTYVFCAYLKEIKNTIALLLQKKNIFSSAALLQNQVIFLSNPYFAERQIDFIFYTSALFSSETKQSILLLDSSSTACLICCFTVEFLAKLLKIDYGETVCCECTVAHDCRKLFQ